VTKPKSIEKFKDLYKHLVNKRKEAIIHLRKTHKIVVEGGEAIPDPLDSFAKMKTAFNLTDFFMSKIKESLYIKPTPVQM
jgi:hypothetical protein